MEIKKKELELIEKEISVLDSRIIKADSLGASTFIAAAIIFLTSPIDAVIKLPVFGISINSINAVYVLYALSLWGLREFFVLRTHKKALKTRHLFVFKEAYGHIPPGIKLIFDGENTTANLLSAKSKLSIIVEVAFFLPIIALYIWILFKLIIMAPQSNFTILIGVYFILMVAYLSVMLVHMFKLMRNPSEFGQLV